MNELKYIQQNIDRWAKDFNDKVDCNPALERLAIHVAGYLDDVVSDIYSLIHKADFPEKSAVDCVYALIHAVNKCGMCYITALDATGEPTKEKLS
jgi:hypothetical protein